MYQNIWCEKRGGNQVEVHLWDDVAGYQNFIFKNYAYVKDGGGQCGLDNMRTLCIGCHKKKTYNKL